METTENCETNVNVETVSPLLFVVFVPHRDCLPALETYRRNLFAAGFDGAFSFPAAAPLALLKRPLNSMELKAAAAELRENSGDKRFNTAGQALHPPPTAAFRGKPRGIKPFVSSLARSCPCKHERDLAPFVNKRFNTGYSECSVRNTAIQLFGITLDMPLPAFPPDAVLYQWEKPILAPAIITSDDNPELSFNKALPEFSFRAAALANLTLEPVLYNQHSFTWEMGPLHWLPHNRKKES